METKVAVVCIIAGVLGLVSAGFGFAAEATRVKASDIIVDTTNEECWYPSSPSSTLGYVSALLLLVATIITNAANGCFCCSARPNREPRCQCGKPLLSFIFSWAAFVPGFLLMLGAATLSRDPNSYNSSHQSQYSSSGSTYYVDCYYVKPGVFAAAACLSLISVFLGLVCYASLRSALRKSGPPAGGNIAMGQPQVPASTYPAAAYQPAYV